MQQVIYHAVLYKKLTIKDVSLFVNYGDRFRSIDNEFDLQNFKERQRGKKLAKEEYHQLGVQITNFVKRAFLDSSKRFDTQKVQLKTANQYIYQEKAFSIDSELQITLNHQAAQEK